MRYYVRIIFRFSMVLFLIGAWSADTAHGEDFLILTPYNPESTIEIQTNTHWTDYAEDLADYKSHYGLTTRVMSLDQVNRGYDGTDEPERVKQAIYYHVKNRGTRYVMLVGDTGVFPVRYTFNGYTVEGDTHWHHDGDHDWYAYEGYGFKPNDGYYSNLWDNSDTAKGFDNWNADGDGFYGEMYYNNFHGVDGNTIHPDVALGRVPCRTPAEFFRYILKIIQYEYISALEQQRALFIGGSFSDSRAVKQDIGADLPADIDIAYLLGGGDMPWSFNFDGDVTVDVDPRSAIIDFVNGYGPPPQFINYAGHGNAESWGEADFTRGDVASLVNSYFPALAIAPASCSTAKFGIGLRYDRIPASPDPGGVNHDSMPEAMLTENSSGAVIYIGGVTSMQPPAFYIDRKFFEAIVAGETRVGDAFRYAIEAYITHYDLDTDNVSDWISVDDWPDADAGGKWDWFPTARFDTVYKTHLFGDPSLRINGVTAPDLTPPTTWADMAEWVNRADLDTAGPGGLHEHPVVLFASDPETGVMTTRYNYQTSARIGDWREGDRFTMTFPIDGSMEGEAYEVHYYSVNRVGRSETVNHDTIGFDFTAPSSSLSITGAEDPTAVDGVVYTDVEKLTISATDALSSVKWVQYRFGEGGCITSVVGDHATIDFTCTPFLGEMDFQYRAVDMAGNAESWKSETFQRRTCNFIPPQMVFGDIMRPLFRFPPRFQDERIDFEFDVDRAGFEPDMLMYEYSGPVTSQYDAHNWMHMGVAYENPKTGAWQMSWDTVGTGIRNGFFYVRSVAEVFNINLLSDQVTRQQGKQILSDPMMVWINTIDESEYNFNVTTQADHPQPGDTIHFQVAFSETIGNLTGVRMGLVVDTDMFTDLKEGELIKEIAELKYGQNWDIDYSLTLAEAIEDPVQLRVGAYIQANEIALLTAKPIMIDLAAKDITVGGTILDPYGTAVLADLLLSCNAKQWETSVDPKTGAYQFETVPAGACTLSIKNLPKGYRPITPDQGTTTFQAIGNNVSRNFLCASRDTMAPTILILTDWQTLVKSGTLQGLAYDTHYGTGIADIHIALTDTDTGKWMDAGGTWQKTEVWMTPDQTSPIDAFVEGQSTKNTADPSDVERIKTMHHLFSQDTAGLVWSYAFPAGAELDKGDKLIMIRAKDGNGNQASASLRNTLIHTDFEAEQQQGKELSVSFTDLSTGPVNLRHWDFGDDTTSSINSPLHDYPAPGKYKISLIAEGTDAGDEITRIFTVTDPDSDDDGLLDIEEDINQNGETDPGETDPQKADTDNDGIQDGTEQGLTIKNIGPGTDPQIFQPDNDPGTRTDPLNPDTDSDGNKDGTEDVNGNGRVDTGESSPSSGDVNGDTHVEIADAVLALQIDAGLTIADAVNLSADVNGDGRIGLAEALYVFRVSAGLIISPKK
jgi:PKD repeat protein